MTVRVNRIEKYWECCKVESECSRDKKGEILLKKAVLAILIAGMPVCFHRIFNVIIVIAASTIVTIQKRTVIFDS